jgi:hypothetical protein
MGSPNPAFTLVFFFKMHLAGEKVGGSKEEDTTRQRKLQVSGNAHQSISV